MGLSRYTIRQIKQRPMRAGLTLLGIAVGVASMVAVLITIETTRHAYREMFANLTGKAELEIVSDGQDGFSPSLANDVKAIPGIQSVVPIIQRPLVIRGKKSIMPAFALGIDPKIDSLARNYVLKTGEYVGGRDGIVLDTNFAKNEGLEVGQKITLLTERGRTSQELIGLIDPPGAASAMGAVVVMSLPLAESIFELKGKVNCLQLVLEPDIDATTFAQTVAEKLPTGFVVQTPATRGSLVQESIRSTDNGLAAMSVVSLVAGGFVILNTFRMTVSERRRQLAILRSLGATREQVLRLLLQEAIILGVLGTIVGLILGMGLAVLMSRAVGSLISPTPPQLRISWQPFLTGVLLGPAISIVASLVPTRAAARRPVLPELLGLDNLKPERPPLVPALLGIFLIASNLLILWAFFQKIFPPLILRDYIPFGMTSFLIAVVLIMPMLVPTVSMILGSFADRLLGLEGKLARRRLERQTNRTGLTVGVLVIATTVTIGMGNTLLCNVRDVRDWYEKAIQADFFVRAAMPNLGTMLSPGLPFEFRTDLESIDGIKHVDLINFHTLQIGKQRSLVLARTFKAKGPLPFDVEGRNDDSLREALERGETVMGTVLARRLGVEAGDTVTIPTKNGPKELRIAALSTEYTAGGVVLYLDWNFAKQLLGFRGVDAYALSVPIENREAVAGQLKSYCESKEIMLQSNRELRKIVDDTVDGVVAFLWILMALSFLVASLGIVNTLTMSVLEQTRELGLMRAVAFTRGQIRRLVLSQALLMGAISLVPGILGGIGLAYLMNRANQAIVGNPVPFTVYPWFVAMCGLAALVTSFLSALAPAERAARLSVPEALKYE